MTHGNNIEDTAGVSIRIEPASRSDLAAILNLLTQSRLPHDGLSEHLTTAIVAREDQEVIGSAALELYGTAALLRSVAVAPAWRGQGLGQRLTRAALELARHHGVRDVYLLTETADSFFPKFGFSRIDRSQVPAPVQTSNEFTSACPDSAPAMELRLKIYE